MTRPGRATWVRVAIVVVVLALLLAAGRDLARAIPGIPGRIAGLGPWGPLAYVGLYAIATVAFVPGAVLTLIAGGVFGVGRGVLVVLAGATIGASIAFLIARYLARGPVERALAGNARFAAVDRAIGTAGRRIVFLLRLSPVFPFNLLNYALGLTTVRFADFLLASPGMIPGTLLYVYTGAVAGEAVAVAGGAAPARGVWYYALVGLGLLATAAVTVIVTRVARRAIDSAII